MDPLAICSLHLHFPFFQIYSHSLETDALQLYLYCIIPAMADWTWNGHSTQDCSFWFPFLRIWNWNSRMTGSLSTGLNHINHCNHRIIYLVKRKQKNWRVKQIHQKLEVISCAPVVLDDKGQLREEKVICILKVEPSLAQTPVEATVSNGSAKTLGIDFEGQISSYQKENDTGIVELKGNTWRSQTIIV